MLVFQLPEVGAFPSCGRNGTSVDAAVGVGYEGGFNKLWVLQLSELVWEGDRGASAAADAITNLAKKHGAIRGIDDLECLRHTLPASGLHRDRKPRDESSQLPEDRVGIPRPSINFFLFLRPIGDDRIRVGEPEQTANSSVQPAHPGVTVLTADASLLALEAGVDPIDVVDLTRRKDEGAILQLQLLFSGIERPPPVTHELRPVTIEIIRQESVQRTRLLRKAAKLA